MQRKYNSNNRHNRLKYADGELVPPNAQTRSEGKGHTRKDFVINQDGSETQVYTAITLSSNRLKYADGELVPPNAQTRSEGKGKTRKHFVINQDGSEIQVYTASMLSNKRLKYDNGELVPPNAQTRSGAGKHFVIHQDGSETQVYTAITLSRNRLKYDNGELVPPNAQTYSEGKGNTRKHFVIHQDGSEIQVYTADTLSNNRLKYDNGELVPPNAQTRSEGKGKTGKHFVIHQDGRETQVYTANTLSKRKNNLIDLPIQKRQRLNPSNDVSMAGNNELNHGISNPGRVSTHPSSLFGQSSQTNPYQFSSQPSSFVFGHSSNQSILPIQEQIDNSHLNTEESNSNVTVINSPNGNGNNDFYQNPLTSHQLLFGDRIQTVSLEEQELGRAQEQIDNSHLNTEESNSNVTVINSPNGNGNNDFYQNPLTSDQLLFGDRIQTVSLEEQELGRAKLRF